MLEIGSKAPEFSLPDQNGEVHTLSDYKGEIGCTLQKQYIAALIGLPIHFCR